MDQNPQAMKLDSDESLNLDGTIRSWSTSKWSKVESLKKMVKFVVSVCVLSLFLAIFSHSPHSFTNFNLHHGMERKYMFLICNGILFLLATSNSVIDQDSSSNFEPNCDYSFSHSHHDHHHQFDPLALAAIEETNQEMETEEKVEEIINGVQLDENEDGDEDEDEDEGCFTDDIEEEEEDEEEEGKGMELEMVVSTEELNKKIEEFIRKMKEEMRIEAAQTQLIAV